MQRTIYLDSIQEYLRDGLTAMDKLSPNFQAKGVVPPRFQAHFAPATARVTTLKAAFQEGCLVETTSDSVRCSFHLKKLDPLEEVLCLKYLRAYKYDANQLGIVQRVPLEGYDLTFLITNRHVHDYGLDEIVTSVVHFMTHIYASVSERKIEMSARGRSVARDFLEPRV